MTPCRPPVLSFSTPPGFKGLLRFAPTELSSGHAGVSPLLRQYWIKPVSVPSISVWLCLSSSLLHVACKGNCSIFKAQIPRGSEAPPSTFLIPSKVLPCSQSSRTRLCCCCFTSESKRWMFPSLAWSLHSQVWISGESGLWAQESDARIGSTAWGSNKGNYQMHKPELYFMFIADKEGGKSFIDDLIQTVQTYQ